MANGTSTTGNTTPQTSLKIPQLKDYGIDPVSGFLPSNPPPVLRLPSQFEPYEAVLDQISSLILAEKVQDIVDKVKD